MSGIGHHKSKILLKKRWTVSKKNCKKKISNKALPYQMVTWNITLKFKYVTTGIFKKDHGAELENTFDLKIIGI